MTRSPASTPIPRRLLASRFESSFSSLKLNRRPPVDERGLVAEPAGRFGQHLSEGLQHGVYSGDVSLRCRERTGNACVSR